MENSDSDNEDRMDYQALGPYSNASLPKKFSFRDTKIEANSLFAFFNKRNDHMKYNTFMLSTWILKLVITVPIIVLFPSHCRAPIDIWLAVISFYDFLKIIARALIINDIVCSRPKKSQTMDSLLSKNESNGINDVTIQFSNSGQTEDYAPQNSKKKELAKNILTASIVLNAGIFIWGQFIWFGPFRHCGDVASAKRVIFYLNIVFGYIYIGLPIFFIVLGCLCFGMLSIASFCCFQRILPKKRNMEKDGIFAGVVKEKYTIDFLGSNDCGLCSMEYEIGEEVITLSCDEKHQFHERCLKKWMEQSGNCPICSKKIRLKTKKMKIKDLKKIASDILN